MSAPANLPPRCDLAAERAALGCVMLDREAFATVAALLSAEDFAEPAHRVIFEAMTALEGRAEPIDVVTLAHVLRAGERLAVAGGAQYIASLPDHVATSAHVEGYCRVVRELAELRATGRALQDALRKARDPACERGDVLEAVARVADVALPRAESEPVGLGAALEEMFDDLDHGASTGLPTGLRDLDALTAGPRAGHLWVLAARPAVGKTALALQFALHVARTVGPVLFVSLEMPRRELVQRLAAGASGVDQQKIRNRTLGGDDMAALVRAAGDVHAAPLWIDDGAETRLPDVRAKARHLARREGGLALVVIDYLQLLRPVKERDNREREVAEVSKGLKAMSKQLNVATLALCQLNRQSEARKDRRPQLSDLRESGAIEQDADLVGLLYREHVHNPAADAREAELIVAKHRHGPTGLVPLTFDPARVAFGDSDAAPAPKGKPRASGHERSGEWQARDITGESTGEEAGDGEW